MWAVDVVADVGSWMGIMDERGGGSGGSRMRPPSGVRCRWLWMCREMGHSFSQLQCRAERREVADGEWRETEFTSQQTTSEIRPGMRRFASQQASKQARRG